MKLNVNSYRIILFLVLTVMVLTIINNNRSNKKLTYDNYENNEVINKANLKRILEEHIKATNNSSSSSEKHVEEEINFEKILKEVDKQEKVTINGNNYYSHKIVLSLLENYSNPEHEGHGNLTTSEIVINCAIIICK